ncbi:ethylene-responsive transcription factor-like protein [Gossypium australe]|uniref:Ethylene-responsive transcription factor-like protein n=1 Tax=Gossypium australe TaxID=47621 RepID=A0A5B6W0M8_9ROSI|nr:ethylene-responsive transcription factor-like protein [Gossypium australe]
MVSLRRRKLLGLCSGRSSFLTPLPRAFDNGNIPENSSHNAKSVSVHPLPSDFINHVHGNMLSFQSKT